MCVLTSVIPFLKKKPCVLLDVSAKCMKLLLLLDSSKNWTHAARMSYVGFGRWISDRGTYGWTLMVTLLSDDWDIVDVDAATANDAILACISIDILLPNVDMTGAAISLETTLGGGGGDGTSSVSELRCLRRALDRVWFNSVCNWFLIPLSDGDFSPLDTPECLFGGKKSNLVGSGRNSWYVPIEIRGPDDVVVGLTPSVFDLNSIGSISPFCFITRRTGKEQS